MTDDLPDHTNYSLIKAVDELGNLVTVLADSSGRIVSVMKGDYAGSMKTLAVDSQGRIQAVLTDPEDVFGNPNYIGAGELAARLGSIKTFEQRGNVTFMDDFESSTLKWTTLGTGTGHAEIRSNESARSGNYSVKLTTGNAVDDYAMIRHYHQLPPAVGSYGCEFSFSLGDGIKYVYLYIIALKTTLRYNCYIRYDPVNNLVEYYDENATWQTLASSLDLYGEITLYHSLKLVYNIWDGKYKRLYLDRNVYDMSTYTINTQALVSAEDLYVAISAVNNAAGNHHIYVDDVIFTQNEP